MKVFRFVLNSAFTFKRCKIEKGFVPVMRSDMSRAYSNVKKPMFCPKVERAELKVEIDFSSFIRDDLTSSSPRSRVVPTFPACYSKFIQGIHQRFRVDCIDEIN